MDRRAPLAAACVVLLLGGCASSRMSETEPDRLFRRGDYAQAGAKLEEGLHKHGESGRDSLLYLLDIGLALHSAGRYEESNRNFLKADQIAEIKDYTSLAAESATLLTTENIQDYKGEDFEKVLINTYLAMNFALMGDTENALVEARRVHRKLERMVTEGQRRYKQSAFARYLSAVLYEAQGAYDDALIDYRKVQELVPGFPGLGRDLWRCAWLSRQRAEMERWAESYGLTDDDRREARRAAPRSGAGELIVLYENGISPRKVPNPDWYSLPKFQARSNPVTEAHVLVNGEERGRTFVLHDIEATAIENLDEKYGPLIAKKLAGVVTKEVVADQIERRTDPLIGFLARVIFYASDQADLRSWNLLPRDLQIFRTTLDPGTYTVALVPVGAQPLSEKVVQVAAGRKVFVNFRYMP